MEQFVKKFQVVKINANNYSIVYNSFNKNECIIIRRKLSKEDKTSKYIINRGYYEK